MWPPTGVRGTTEVRSLDKCCLTVLWGGERGRSGACQGWREGSRRFHFYRSRISHGLIVFGSRKLDIISGEHFLSRKEGLIHFAHFPTCRRGFLRGKHCCVDSMSVQQGSVKAVAARGDSHAGERGVNVSHSPPHVSTHAINLPLS